MSSYLGVDVGGTASRWAVVDDAGAVLLRGSAPGATGHLFNATEHDRFREMLAAISGEVAGFAPHSAAFGVTGLGESAHGSARELIERVLKIVPSQAALNDDMELAFRAVFAPGTGHLVSAGTGSIGIHIRVSGEIVRVGGRGMLVDDGGSGTWIALNALRQVFRQIDESDGSGAMSVLAEELFTQIGGDQWDDARRFVYGGERGRIGVLAQAVARAADRDDEAACDILENAGHELARLGRALAMRTGRMPVAFIGGIIELHPIVKHTLETEFADTEVVFPKLDMALYAARTALRSLIRP